MSSRFLAGVALPTYNMGGGEAGSLPVYGGDKSNVLIENTAGGPAIFRRIYAEEVLDALAVNLSTPQTTVLEIGEYTLPMSFTATYQRSGVDMTVLLISCQCTDNQGGSSKDLKALNEANSFLYEDPVGTSYSKELNNGNVLFTLTAEDTVSGPVADTVNIRWQPRVFRGVKPYASSIDEAFVKSLNSDLRSSRSLTFQSSDAGAGEHIYFALPSAYGTPVFNVGGFVGGFIYKTTLVITADTTNAPAQTYDIFESDQDNLGITVINVS